MDASGSRTAGTLLSSAATLDLLPHSLACMLLRLQRMEAHNESLAKKNAAIKEALARKAAESQQEEQAPAAADAQPLFSDRDTPKVAGHFMRRLKPHQVRAACSVLASHDATGPCQVHALWVVC
jgi:hypothetical protein